MPHLLPSCCYRTTHLSHGSASPMHVGDTDGVSEGTACGGEAEGRHSPTQLPTPQEAAGTLWHGLARLPIPLTTA